MTSVEPSNSPAPAVHGDLVRAVPGLERHHDDWAAWALEHTRRRLALGASRYLPWRRGLWVTARPSYRMTALPEGFVIEELEVPGGRRRLAFREGVGRPLLILPGLYSALGEALFCGLAREASRSGRPVALLEDQLAGPTLRISGGRWTSFAEQGQQASLVARRLSARPDVVALSAGCMVALSAPRGAWHRLVGWSAVVDDSAMRAVGDNSLLNWHFRRSQARAFEAAGIEAPGMDDLCRRLFEMPRAPEPSCPCLFVHAEDDPVAPARAVRRCVPEVLVTSWGGHLGFGAVVGVDVYISPLVEHAAWLDRPGT